MFLHVIGSGFNVDVDWPSNFSKLSLKKLANTLQALLEWSSDVTVIDALRHCSSCSYLVCVSLLNEEVVFLAADRCMWHRFGSLFLQLSLHRTSFPSIPNNKFYSGSL